MNRNQAVKGQGKGSPGGQGWGTAGTKAWRLERVEDFGRSQSLVTVAVASPDLRGVARGEGPL